MLETDEKITALIVKLNRLTSLGELHWAVEDPPGPILRGTDYYIPFFMSAFYKGKRFGLYQQRYQSYDGDRDRLYWNERLVLALLDVEDRILWETSQQYSALGDLFETARRKVANVDEILDDILNNDDEI